MAGTQRPFVFLQRFRPLLVLAQNIPMADPGDDVLRRHRHGALQQRGGRTPDGQLEARGPSQRNDQAGRRAPRHPAPFSACATGPRARPHHACPHGRQIEEPVAESLRGARPDQSNRRHQHPQHPQQADQEFRTAAAIDPSERQSRRQSGHRPREAAPMERRRRIEYGQILWPDRLAQIHQVVSGNQKQAPPQRRHVRAHILHRPGHEPSDVAKPERRNPESPFLLDQLHRLLPTPVEPPQRPDVQQQQDKRRRDQRAGLRPHGERQARRARRIFPALGRSAARIEPQAQQKEKSAQHAFAFGDPSHAFHAQRMPRPKQRQHDRQSRRLGPAAQQPEEQSGVQRVQHHVGQMEPPGFRPPQFRVRLIAHPKQRGPITHMVRRPRPANGFRRHPPAHHRIGAHVGGIVEADEIVSDGGNKQCERQRHHREDRPCGPALSTCIFDPHAVHPIPPAPARQASRPDGRVAYWRHGFPRR